MEIRLTAASSPRKSAGALRSRSSAAMTQEEADPQARIGRRGKQVLVRHEKKLLLVTGEDKVHGSAGGRAMSRIDDAKRIAVGSLILEKRQEISAGGQILKLKSRNRNKPGFSLISQLPKLREFINKFTTVP